MKEKSIISFLMIMSNLHFPHLCSSYEKHAPMPEPDQTIHEIIDETINSITKKYKLKPCGIGMNGKFEYVEISFQTSEILDKENARILLVDCVEQFLKKINSNEKIRPFLKPHPFTSENVGIVFYISDEKNNDVFHPQISIAKWFSKGVSFKTVDKENIYRFKEVYHETHEEALDMVKK